VEDKAHARDAKARASQAFNAGRLSAADKTKVDHKADAVLAKKGKANTSTEGLASNHDRNAEG